jgi:two-component system, response regulator
MKTKTILYVEDNPLDVGLTLEAFKENKIANPIMVLHDGVEALKYLRYEDKYKDRKQENPCMILLDLKMPRMDGLEFLEIVKNDLELKRIPIIMLTSSSEEKDLIKGYNLGVNAYVVKPVDFLTLIDIVKQIQVFWITINVLPHE